MSNIKPAAYLKGIHATTSAMGDKVISSDAFLEIHGFEYMGFLIKQFPWPHLTSGGEIEVPMPLGLGRWQTQQAKTHQQGPITLMETEAGHVRSFLELVVAQGGRFNATAYEGTPDDFKRTEELVDCFFQLDPSERDWENRAQIQLISGTLFFHYFANQ